MTLGVALIFAITIINGHGRIFWEDETLGWTLLRDPSWRHMLQAWKLGADGGGIVFYILGRMWFRCFGDSVLAFRLFTATSFGLSFPVLWLALRRFYSTGIVAFAVFNTLFFSPPLTMHYMEGRFYGLLMLGTAMALWLTLALDSGRSTLRPSTYLATFCIHLFLTGSHVLGVVYSASLLLALILLDRLRGRRRPGLYLAASSAWLLLLLERSAMAATALVGKPHFWTTPPTLGQVLGAYTVFSPEIFAVFVILSLCAMASLPRSHTELFLIVRSTFLAKPGLYLITGCLLLVPIALLLEGLSGTWLFTDRYLQPVALGVCCLTAELLCFSLRDVRPAGFPQRRPRTYAGASIVVSLTFLVALLFWVFRHEAQYTPSVPDFTSQLTEHIPRALPVVVEDAATFTELMSRPAGAMRPFTFLLDWHYANSAEAPRMEVTQFNLMQNWKRAGYYADRIESREAFLSQHQEFLIVSNTGLGDQVLPRPETGNPLARELATTPDFTLRRLFVLDRLDRDHQRDTVWLVCHGACPVSLTSQYDSSPSYCALSSNGEHCSEMVDAPAPLAMTAESEVRDGKRSTLVAPHSTQ